MTRKPKPPAPTFQDAGSAAIAAGVAQRMADGSVVFSRTRVIQRAAMTSELPAPDPLPDPPPAPEPDPLPAAVSDPASGSDDPAFPDATTPGAPGSAESAPPGSPAQSAGTGVGTGANTAAGTPPVTDELVRALYAPLSRLLKADLRLERERAGFLINTRH
ncbi:hypothetical protein OIE62_08560 [Streptomyces scopuliridis]|uniref:Uncharacterized protein n=1 Tax=Streptomyces scopuliridis TaxID=452529 RepID=A0ACD4ZUD6_9ACTN|nr:hypothetical protein [Streptomyces scopuliridis]WSC01393.1 hypothetical protein OG835_33260 [Streptomyces scopuliridis]WSC05070.1 hypothetical protein OIE62_08560 [Streptomyces scopuliridis]